MRITSLFCFFQLVLGVIPAAVYAQGGSIFVNRVFQDASGSPAFNPALNPWGLQWSKSIHTSVGDLVTVGHTLISGQEDIFVVKYDADGAVLFQQNYDVGGAGFNDYGTDICEAANGDLLVCGATDNGGATNYDLVILRITSSGTLIGYDMRAGAAGKNDFAVGIAEDASTGLIYVAANREVSSGNFDYWAISWDQSLNFQNENFYDYMGLNDIAIGLELTSTALHMVGASQSGLTACDYALAKFNLGSLSYSGDSRSSLPGIAQDRALAFCRDAANNTYITGQGWNGTDFDIKTVKIAANLTIAWTDTFDVYGFDDAANTIVIDPLSGELVAGGYVTRTGNHKNLVCIRYNPSTGVRTSVYDQPAENTLGDAYIKKLYPGNNGHMYFIAGEKNLAGSTQVIVGRMNGNGTRSWQKKIVAAPGNNVLPSDIRVSGNGIYAISVLDSVTDAYLTTAYEEFVADSSRNYAGAEPVYKKRDLIVSFLPDVINKAMIDDQAGTRVSEFGDLSDFLTHTADSTVRVALSEVCAECDIKVIRIFSLKTSDTVAVSRLGQNVSIPPFWSTLLLQFPAHVNLQSVGNALKSLPAIVAYAHPNSYFKPLTNDPLYPQQLSLTGANFTNINTDGAWSLDPTCGLPYIKGGLFDQGVEWQHEDFGYTSSPTSGKMQGWYFPRPGNQGYGDMDIRANISTVYPNDIFGHGTNNAGIIAAERNNGKGIAGVAGGDAVTGNPGVTLYSFNTVGVDMVYVLRALNESCFSNKTINRPYRYGIHFSNHSYKQAANTVSADTFAAYREQVHFQNRMGITFIASRGNDGMNSQIFPACFDSSWVISVGGVDSVNQKWPLSSYGSKMDVIAPAVRSRIRTTDITSINSYGSPAGNGTSLAAPFVSGVVALLMGYMNDSVPNYRNLAPEDCEFIIQRSASDFAPLGYDSLTGYGLVNAGKALKMVEKPFRTLYHFGTNAITPHTIHKSLYSSADTIILIEKYENPLTQVVYTPGTYIVKTFQIDANVSHPGLYPSDSILYYWPRHSGSYLYDLPNSQKKLNLHEKTKIVSFNGNNADVRGYVYQVKDLFGVSIGWWPCDTSLVGLVSAGYSPMEYSVLTYNRAIGIKANPKESSTVKVFPNPSNKDQTLEIESESDAKCVVELYDLMGRLAKTVYTDRILAGKTIFTHDISNLPNSMYIYVIKLNNKVLKQKFIKE